MATRRCALLGLPLLALGALCATARAAAAGWSPLGGPYPPEAICGVLRANLRDMKESNDIMKRCMTGHSLRENVGQMEASMGDVQMVIGKRCR